MAVQQKPAGRCRRRAAGPALLLVVLLAGLLGGAGCRGSADVPSAAPSQRAPASAGPASATASDESVPHGAASRLAAPGEPTGSPAGSVSSSPAPFRAAVASIGPALRHRMRWSWRPGCPVPLADLRYLTVSVVGFDGRPGRGELVVHEDAVDAVRAAFGGLYRAGVPVRRMRLVDDYRGDDAASMAADNSSAFNCRRSTGSPGAWSQHAYGRAVDLNPVENPSVGRDGTVAPPAGAAFLDRTRRRPGMVVAGGPAVRAFAAVGWGWGGRWRGSRDYQHFSADGR